MRSTATYQNIAIHQVKKTWIIYIVWWRISYMMALVLENTVLCITQKDYHKLIPIFPVGYIIKIASL